MFLHFLFTICLHCLHDTCLRNIKKQFSKQTVTMRKVVSLSSSHGTRDVFQNVRGETNAVAPAKMHLSPSISEKDSKMLRSRFLIIGAQD